MGREGNRALSMNWRLQAVVEFVLNLLSQMIRTLLLLLDVPEKTWIKWIFGMICQPMSPAMWACGIVHMEWPLVLLDCLLAWRTQTPMTLPLQPSSTPGLPWQSLTWVVNFNQGTSHDCLMILGTVLKWSNKTEWKDGELCWVDKLDAAVDQKGYKWELCTFTFFLEIWHLAFLILPMTSR